MATGPAAEPRTARGPERQPGRIATGAMRAFLASLRLRPARGPDDAERRTARIPKISAESGITKSEAQDAEEQHPTCPRPLLVLT